MRQAVGLKESNSSGGCGFFSAFLFALLCAGLIAGCEAEVRRGFILKAAKERKIHGLCHVRPHFSIHLPGDNTIRHNSFSL